MLNEQERIEAELERDPQLRRQLLQHAQMEQALRASLGGANSNERVKQSVLTVVRGEQEDALKQRVMADATRNADSLSAVSPTGSRQRAHPSAGCQPAKRQTASRRYGVLASLLNSFRRPAFAVGLVAVSLAIFAAIWFGARPTVIVANLELPSRIQLASGAVVPKVGDAIQVSDSGSATVTFADGTTVHLEPGTEIIFQPVANPPRPGGKQLKLVSGSLSADVAKQPPGLPLLIQTPHALVTVVGTEFDLSVATNQTALEVTRGLVKMTGSGERNPVSVAAGEFAVAAPRAALQYGRLPRNPFFWPFSSTSIWNRSLGSGAQFAPVPGKPFLADGPLTNALHGRKPFLARATDPLRNIWVNGEVRADAQLSDAALPHAGIRDSIVLLQRARRYALELRDVTVRADGDLAATDSERTDLAGAGVNAHAVAALPFGLSNLGGLIRFGENQQGIRHALSARVQRERLGGRKAFASPSTIWPATGGDAVGKNLLSVGALLAIPPDVDIKQIVGNSGPSYELARAMQDYGVYITGYINTPFVLVTGEVRFDNADELLNKLVPLLQVVTNNTPQTPAGGGTPRRESAPALPGEAK